ncbi:MAG: Uncharacterized protein XD69_0795 [Clostridia bacterium 62_21]|nr:MAG: Uncharacterized protein XD69_0795 [Clostridia bacterium 62_21]
MITAHDTVLQVLEKHPETKPVFDRYGKRLGVCLTCRALFNTLEEAAQANGIPLEDFLADLNEAVARRSTVRPHAPECTQ